jgi:hypothetical protein
METIAKLLLIDEKTPLKETYLNKKDVLNPASFRKRLGKL